MVFAEWQRDQGESIDRVVNDAWALKEGNGIEIQLHDV